MEKNSNKLIRKIIYLIVIGFFSLAGNAQPKGELGIPYIKNFSTKEYKGEPYVFGIAQDTNGIVYFTGNGIIEYDGDIWRKTSFKGTFTWSIVIGDDNRIYIGGTDEFGFLRTNSVGEQEYVSLLNLLPKNQRNIGQLRQIIALDNKIYFSSSTTGQLIRYDISQNSIDVWNEKGNISLLGAVYDELYLMVSELGLCKLVNNEFELLVKKADFANSDLVSVLPWGNQELLICTKDKGLFIYKDSKVIPFVTEADKLLHTRVYFGKILLDETILLSIIGQGIIVLDKSGKWLQHLTKKEGSIDNIVLTAKNTSSGDVWLGTYKGISKIAFASPVSRFTTDENGITISANDIMRFGDKLYLASANLNGLLYLDREGAVFRKVKNSPRRQVFDLEKSKNQLYGVVDGDVYQVTGTNAKPIYQSNDNDKYVFSIYPSKVNGNRLFLGLRNGLASIYKKANEWDFEKKYNRIPANVEIRGFKEFPKGHLWIETGGQGLWSIEYNNNDDSLNIMKVKHFKNGLQNLNFKSVKVFVIDNKATFAGTGGIFTYEETKEQLIPDNRFPLPILSLNIQSVQLVESKSGDVYAYFSQFNDEMLLGVYRKQNNNTYAFEANKLQQVSNEDIITVSKLYSESDTILWIDSENGLIRFDTKKQVPKTTIPTKIREVHLNSDSLIFAGHGIPSKPTLPITQNNINFHYLAPTINITGNNQYQTKLEGFDKEWSDWTTKTDKAYTNLHEGIYTFKARRKTPTGQACPEATYSFEVLPPWWRTWWAYLSYIFFGGLSLYLFGQWRNRQLLERSKKLELIIQERTAEIAQLFQEAQAARAAAEEANEAKSTFLSTVSHELRTPLTSVIGFAKIIKKRLDERILPFVQSEEKKTQRAIKQVTQNLDVVVSEGERLTTLINDVLDLAKIEAGRLDWNMDFIQIKAVIKQATAATSALFEQKALPLELAIDENLPAINGDKDRLVQVVINLISNAVKFTDEGNIKVSAIQENGSIIVSVKDSGIGIAKEDLPKVFEKFKQVGDTLTDKPKGTGLGLPICKEIVEHHQGKIWVESEFGEGSIFKFNIPLSAEQTIAKTSLEKEIVAKKVSPSKNEAAIIKDTVIQKTILIVDDERDIRNLLRQEISEAGFLVKEATNGKEGIERIRQAQPDLVILDIIMPEMNGFDVAAILKNDPATKHIPIIVVSITDDKRRIAQLGIERYLTKPIDINQLLKDIKTLLG